MDQETGDCTQGQSTPVTDDIVVKLEPAWSMKEEPQDQPSAVYSTVQPMSDNTPGSLLSQNTSHACQRCSAVFMLSSSLQLHLEVFHRETLHSELPVASRLQDSASENTVKMPSGQERSSTPMTEDSRADCATPSQDFVIKLEPAWSMKEEPQDQPSAVYNTVQPMTDNTSGSLLSLNTSHVCQRCSATFVLFSSLELHMATLHGETLHDFLPMYSACYSVGYRHDSNTESVGNCGSYTESVGNCGGKTTVKGGKERVEDSDTDATDEEEKSRKRVCDVCNKAFSTGSHLNRHKLIHTGRKLFVCDVCSKSFTVPGDLKRHRLSHSGLKPFVCDVCSKAFTRAYVLKTHKLIHSGLKPFECDACGKGFRKADHLKMHKLTHIGHKQFVCDVCSKGFTKASYLKSHKASHAGHGSFVCDDGFTLAGDLTTHKVSHEGVKSERCSDFDADFSRSVPLQSRMGSVDSYDIPNVSDVCQKVFSVTDSLERHKRIRTGKKTHTCEICWVDFTEAGSLKNHKRIHTGEKPFSCDVCGAAFSQSGHLKQHKRIHSGVKPYVCTDCGKGFALSGDLKRHELTHTGEKPCVCTHCWKRFALASDLKKHRLTHTGERPHACTHCTAAFTQSSHLNRHVRKLHS